MYFFSKRILHSLKLHSCQIQFLELFFCVCWSTVNCVGLWLYISLNDRPSLFSWLPENTLLVSTSQNLSLSQSMKRKMTHWHLQNQLFSNFVDNVTSQMRIKEAVSMWVALNLPPAPAFQILCKCQYGYGLWCKQGKIPFKTH